MRLLALDQSLAATGIVVVDVTASRDAILEQCCVVTKPDHRARHLYQADEDGARVDSIALELLAVLDRWAPDVVALEAPAGAQSSTAAKALGLAYGVCRGVLRAKGLVPLVIQAHHAKRAVTGHDTATKDEVVSAVSDRWTWTPPTTKRDREAIADALAVATAALEEPAIAALARSEKGA